MFCSGAETRRLLAKENRRNTLLLDLTTGRRGARAEVAC
jgi:hypothetical protein